MAAKTCPEEVVALVEYLKSTGTGQGKLDALTKLGCECASGTEFLIRLKDVIPPGTLKKAMKFVEQAKGVKAPPTLEPTAEKPADAEEPTAPKTEAVSGTTTMEKKGKK